MKKTGGDIIFEGRSSFVTKLDPGLPSNEYFNSYFVVMQDKFEARCQSDNFDIQVPICSQFPHFSGKYLTGQVFLPGFPSQLRGSELEFNNLVL